MKKEWTIFFGLTAIFLLAYFLNFTDPSIQRAIMDAFYMLQWYARNHTLACVVPAMFIAGAIASFLSKEAVLRHLGPKANKIEAYSVASVSGTVLAVCSCSVLPMFAGIYRVGAGLGPASAFLYSGPAINVMAIFLTARVLGFDLGIARVIGSVVFAVVIGVIMAAIFRKDEEKRETAFMQLPEPPAPKRSLLQTALFFATMIAFLVFSDWANPSQTTIEKTDGTRMRVAVLLETTEMLRVQLEEPVGEKKKGEKLPVLKSEIARTE
ncbi:MAG: permease, partial [Thermoguttaceae bacterium]|nr:permease [Thermoguttaceae bacterium]